MIFAYTKAKAESVSRVGDSFFCYRRSQIAFRYLSLSLSLSLVLHKISARCFGTGTSHVRWLRVGIRGPSLVMIDKDKTMLCVVVHRPNHNDTVRGQQLRHGRLCCLVYNNRAMLYLRACFQFSCQHTHKINFKEYYFIKDKFNSSYIFF